MSNKEAFFALANRPLRTTEIELAGQRFRLREISEADASEMEIKIQAKDGKWDYARHRMLLVTYSLVDDEGNRIVEDWEQLKNAPRSVVGPLYEAALSLSRYDESEINDLAKKSGGAEG